MPTKAKGSHSKSKPKATPTASTVDFSPAFFKPITEGVETAISDTITMDMGKGSDNDSATTAEQDGSNNNEVNSKPSAISGETHIAANMLGLTVTLQWLEWLGITS